MQGWGRVIYALSVSSDRVGAVIYKISTYGQKLEKGKK